MDEIDEALEEVFLLDDNAYNQSYQEELHRQFEEYSEKYKEAGYKNIEILCVVKNLV